jgi:hypothetical protein
MLAMKKLIGLCLLLSSCASTRGYHVDPNDTSSPVVYGSGMGDRSHLPPAKDWWFDGLECSPEGVTSAWRNLYTGKAGPHETLYYYRCKEPNEYVKLLRELRSRTLYRPEVSHHPTREK